MDLAVQRVQNEMPCPVCGQKANYSWGEFGNAEYAMYTMPKAKPGFWGSMEGIRITTRRCNECGNIQHFDRKFVLTPAKSVFAPEPAPDPRPAYAVMGKTTRPGVTQKRIKREMASNKLPTEVPAEEVMTEGEQRWQEYLDGKE